MPREFLISEDKSRNVKTVGWFLSDGRMHVQVRQYVSDAMLDGIKTLRETVAADGGRPNTQSHWRHVAEIPDTIYGEIMKGADGKQLALSDPERDKRMTRFLNDSDNRKLRVTEGRV